MKRIKNVFSGTDYRKSGSLPKSPASSTLWHRHFARMPTAENRSEWKHHAMFSMKFIYIHRFRLQYASMTKSFNDISKRKNTRFAGACHIRMCSNWSVWTEWTLLILRAGRFSHTSNGHCHGGGSSGPMIETIKTQIGPLGVERTWFAGAEILQNILLSNDLFEKYYCLSGVECRVEILWVICSKKTPVA